MAALAIVFYAVGLIIAVVGGIMLLIAAFKESVWWGLGCFFFSFPVTLIFLITNWSVAKKPFLIQLLSIPFLIIAGILAALAAGGAA